MFQVLPLVGLVLCDLCIGYQRQRNKCVGYNFIGNKPYHCTVCHIKECLEKKGDEKMLCSECGSFPCKRIINLDKRYSQRYGESPIQNIKKHGSEAFIEGENEKWKCKQCGTILCAH